MEVTVRAHAFDLSEGARQYAETKIGRAVQKVLRGNARVDVDVTELARGGAREAQVKVTVALPRAQTAVVTVQDPEIRAAIDVAADKIGRAIRKTKERRRDKGRTGAAMEPVAPPEEPADDSVTMEM